jgi:hypothetical protein
MLVLKEFHMRSRIKNLFLSIALVSIFISAFVPTVPVFANESGNNIITSKASFIESVKNGDASVLRGIYVQNVMAYEIKRQPSGYPGYVTSETNTVTHFKMASQFGIIGLLAHNHLAGANFSTLKVGDVITLVYGDGHTQNFYVEEILEYQATHPLSPYSNFIDLDTEEFLTAENLFNKVYRGDFHVTLQTVCKQRLSGRGNLR